MFKLLNDNREVIATAVTRAGIERAIERMPIEASFILTPDGSIESL